jgi:hypothetical protein
LPAPATIVRQASAQKYVILRIERIRGDNVILRCALDRYRIPLDATLAKTYVYTIEELVHNCLLLHSRMHVCARVHICCLT